jgi:alpha-beta hydrolase superfamily lysophospholipase
LEKDIAIVMKKARTNIPLFLYGHSMGGALTSKFLMNNPDLNVSGLVLSAPLFSLPPEKQVEDPARLAFLRGGVNLVRVLY